MKLSVLQGSDVVPLMFLLYINDLYMSIKYSIARHFPDDTSFEMTLSKNKSLKIIKKCVNKDLNSLNEWLKAKKDI